MDNAFVEVGGQCGEYFRRNLIFPQSKSKDALLYILTKTGGSDAYYCTYLFDKKDRSEGTKFLSPLYFDIDGDITTDEGFETLRFSALSLIANLSLDLRLKTNEFKIYFSGSKGFHIFVGARILAIKPYEKLNLVYKAFVQHMQKKTEHGELIDTKIYDNKRLIRIPNSVNAKTGLYKIPLQYATLRTIKRGELLNLAKTKQPDYAVSTEPNMEAAARFRECIQQISSAGHPRNSHAMVIPKEKQSLPVCMRYLLQADVAKGGRNNYLAMLASILLQNGYSAHEALEVMELWNRNNSEPLEEREIQSIMQSALRMIQNGHGYGCTSIRSTGVFPPRELCPKCKIYQCIERRG